MFALILLTVFTSVFVDACMEKRDEAKEDDGKRKK
jgi:hypothetical protein